MSISILLNNPLELIELDVLSIVKMQAHENYRWMCFYTDVVPYNSISNSNTYELAVIGIESIAKYVLDY